jgi:hypothetical protein
MGLTVMGLEMVILIFPDDLALMANSVCCCILWWWPGSHLIGSQDLQSSSRKISALPGCLGLLMLIFGVSHLVAAWPYPWQTAGDS